MSVDGSLHSSMPSLIESSDSESESEAETSSDLNVDEHSKLMLIVASAVYDYGLLQRALWGWARRNGRPCLLLWTFMTICRETTTADEHPEPFAGNVGSGPFAPNPKRQRT